MEKGRELLNRFYRHYHKNQREGGLYLASLSDEEFKSILKLPIGMPRSYLSQMRNSFNPNKLHKYIIHIPHASLDIPDSFKKQLKISYDKFMEENIFISDYRIDEFIPKKFSNIVKFNYSRMYCDVERYLDDEKEEMSKYGMGVLYTKDSNGKEFVKGKRKGKLELELYKEHHSRLDNMVEDVINKCDECFIIDLHSFSDEFVYKMFNKKNNPDICIGINKSNYDIDLLEKTINHFSSFGYSVMINYPYSGSIISNKYPKVKSIMIEVNKRVYSDDFYKCMMKYYDMLQ